MIAQKGLKLREIAVPESMQLYKLLTAVTPDSLTNFTVIDKEYKVLGKIKDSADRVNDKVKDMLGVPVRNQQVMQGTSQDYSFDALRSAFYAYDIVKATDGSSVVVAKSSDMVATDPMVIAQVEYANVWFDEITKYASRSTLNGDPKQDDGLVDIAFGKCGEEAYNNVQNSFIDAFEKSSKDSSTFGNAVVSNLKNSQMTSSYGADIQRTLCMSDAVIAVQNETGQHPEVFQAKTFEFMANGYLASQAEKGLLDKAKDAVIQAKEAIYGALGLNDAPKQSNDPQMSR